MFLIHILSLIASNTIKFPNNIFLIPFNFFIYLDILKNHSKFKLELRETIKLRNYLTIQNLSCWCHCEVYFMSDANALWIGIERLTSEFIPNVICWQGNHEMNFHMIQTITGICASTQIFSSSSWASLLHVINENVTMMKRCRWFWEFQLGTWIINLNLWVSSHKEQESGWNGKDDSLVYKK